MKTDFLLAMTAALALTGCGSLLSLNPLYTAGDVVFDPALLGAWESTQGKNVMVVRRADDNAYQVLFASMEDSSVTMKLEARLVEIKGHRLVDLLRETEGWSIPAHASARITLAGSELRIAFFESDWLKKELVNERPMLRPGNDRPLVLPDSTAALQQLLLKYAEEPKALEEVTFRRVQ